MKKAAMYFLLTILLYELHARGILISFNGNEQGTTIDSVMVENLTQGTSLTLSGENMLYLTSVISDIKHYNETEKQTILFYPNPVSEYGTLEFETSGGVCTIELYDISGSLTAHLQINISAGSHAFKLGSLKSGLYTLRIISPEGTYTGKILSQYSANDIARITYLGQSGNPVHEIRLKSTGTITQMLYNEGDRLKFTGFHDIYKTIFTDIPTEEKTLTFDFTGCTDGDNNTYATVQIGAQLWMAENLKTTRYTDGSEIPLVTDNKVWKGLATPAYCWFNNDSAMYARQYGALYDWFAFSEGNLCPSGWHVPSNEEWSALETYLTDNGYGFEGYGNDYSKSLAANSGWASYDVPGTAGNNQAGNNTTAFGALPAGYRYFDGTYKEMGTTGNWWSFTGKEPDCFAFYWSLGYNSFTMYNYKVEREWGYSVRCLKD